MFSDFKYILFWWLTLFLLGSLSLPLIFALFKNFWDKGYIFSKIVSYGLITYLVFVLGVFKFLPFTNGTIFFVATLLLIADILYLSRANRFAEFIAQLRSARRAIILEEVLFLFILSLWSFVRGFSPDIDNLEKFMDWGFINSMLRSTYMPPPDMWYAGEPINYYYFGHLIFAVLTKVSGIASAITYNLAIATVCSLAFTSAFSLSSNLTYLFRKLKPVLSSPASKSFKRPKSTLPTPVVNFSAVILTGLFSAILLTFGGNLHTVYKLAKLNMNQNNGRLVLNSQAISRAASSYWYPDATRFIGFDPDINDKTIHEFPLYSFVVADLHGHMNDIPVVIFFLAFLLALSLSPVSSVSWKLIIPSSLILSVAFMSNAWDFFVYGLAFASIIFFVNLSRQGFLNSLNSTVINGILVVVFWYLFTLPFSLNFVPMAAGIRLVDQRTPLYQLLVLYGGFWLICLPLFFRLVYEFFKNRKTAFISPPKVFALTLIIVATVLIILPEIVYLKDIYIYEHRRANTMFKLVYQGFILYSLAAGFSLYYLSSNIKTKGLLGLYKLAVLFVFTSHLIYPYFAIRSAYGSLSDYKGLWGLGFLKRSYPDNFAATEWINKNITGQPVMLEAAGDSYTLYNQISVVTGLPTVEGWLVHEWLWHGGTKDADGKYINKTDCGDPCSIRNPDVQKIYETKDADEARRLLQKYSVDYVYIGDLEKEKYPQIDTDKFQKLGRIVYESGTVRIYHLDK
jgi:uncharacterized membrane protein